MMEDRCDNCRFNHKGHCRRFPPQVVFVPRIEGPNESIITYEGFNQAFPDVPDYGWCGEHSPVEVPAPPIEFVPVPDNLPPQYSRYSFLWKNNLEDYSGYSMENALANFYQNCLNYGRFKGTFEEFKQQVRPFDDV